MVPAFSFMTAGDIRFGRGVATEAAVQIATYGQRALLIHGKNASRSDWLAKALYSNGCQVRRFTVAKEPDTSIIQEGTDTARRFGADVVIALGGGAVVDTGKAIAALAPSPRPMLDHLEIVGKGLPLECDPLTFVAIPTTAGTGAEVTCNAVIRVVEENRKVSMRDRRLYPKLALVDPALTDTCPRPITFASGLDAITQVIEPYLCTQANEITDALCRDAIPRGLKALNDLVHAEDPHARDEMAWVSLSGGLALANAGLGAVHGLAGPLGGLTGAAHGAICGGLLPHVLSANARLVEDENTLARIQQIRCWIANTLGGPTDEAFSRLADWARAAGLPDFKALGINKAQCKAAAVSAASSSSMKANPVMLGSEILEEIMTSA
jgi:alcohol dehydrogenase class IV